MPKWNTNDIEVKEPTKWPNLMKEILISLEAYCFIQIIQPVRGFKGTGMIPFLFQGLHDVMDPVLTIREISSDSLILPLILYVWGHAVVFFGRFVSEHFSVLRTPNEVWHSNIRRRCHLDGSMGPGKIYIHGSHKNQAFM